ncbi:MAG: hypothetical protein IT317_14365 [Anaerolineales bacterium]|nr:hypothetical protein [Anaerolineales bacterium]
MPLPDPAGYAALRPRFAVSGAEARIVLAALQPLAQEALGIHTQRQTLVDGELPAYVVMTTPESNGGWGELMPVWFKPYERPVPLYCLDNWALFAALYQAGFGTEATPVIEREALLRVILGADLLMPFLPSTGGAGGFLRHGILPLLLAILWLEPPVRDAWLTLHARGARAALARGLLPLGADVAAKLDQVEQAAWLVPARGLVAGEPAVTAFLHDADRAGPFADLFAGICVMVSALAAAWGVDWHRWVFQAVNVAYRTPDFGLAEVAAWMERSARPPAR